MSPGLRHPYAFWQLRGRLGRTIGRLGSVATRHPVKALVGVALLVLLALWIRTYAGRAIVLPFVAGSGWEADHGQRPESELAAALAAWQERELLARRHLFAPLGRFEFAEELLPQEEENDLEDVKTVCRWFLEEPGLGYYDSFLFRVTDQDSETGGRAPGTRGLMPVGGPGELKTPFGTVPLQVLNRALLTLLPIVSEVYSGSAILQGDSLEVQVHRVKPEPANWRASGPVTARAEIFEYLALSLHFPWARGRDLALSLGVEALEAGLLRRAADFFEIARGLSSADREVEVLLGLTLYALAAESGTPAGREGDPPGDEPPSADGRDEAIRALERAVRAPGPGPGEALSPYLLCLLLVSGREAEVVFLEEEARYEAWRERLEDPAGFAERSRLLAHYPLPGPERHLAQAEVGILMVAGDGTLVWVRPEATPERVGSPGPRPRQILELPSRGSEDPVARPLILWGDGRLFTWGYDSREGSTYPVRPHIPGAAHQMARTRTGDKVFVLNRYGQVLVWEPYDSEATPLSIDGPPSIYPLRQILVWGEKLYLLANDGTVWGASVEGGHASRLTAPAPVHEIVVGESFDGELFLFLLYQNGNIWAYRDAREFNTAEPILFDDGTNTRQIFAADGYLYVLKESGQVWRRQIARGGWFRILEAEALRFGEILVVRAGDGSRFVYLKNTDHELYQGLDLDGLPENGMSVQLIYPPPEGNRP